MRNLWRGIFCCLLLALIGSGLWATVVSQTQGEETIESEISPSSPESVGQAPRMTTEDLTRHSEFVVVGTCTGVESAWIDRILVTRATISVSEVIKGEPVSTVTVVLPGGVDANRKIPVAMTYPGAPQIVPDEEVFLFLTNEDEFADGYTISGYAQGKLSVVTDTQGQKAVSRDLTQLKLQGGPGTVRGTVTLTPLSQFKAEVESYVQE